MKTLNTNLDIAVFESDNGWAEFLTRLHTNPMSTGDLEVRMGLGDTPVG
jgi:hypothetical protein